MRVVSKDGKYEGASRVVDLGTGLYQAFYSAPMPGKYHVHIAYNELGSSDTVPIRGSPFTIEMADPWTKHRVMGAIPARRKGVTLVSMGNELLVYGGDRSGVSYCNTDSSDWRWMTLAPGGDAPVDRTLHTSTVVGDSMVVFGGTSLLDSNDLNDMYFLRKEGEAWVWSHPAESKPYLRHPDLAPKPAAPEEGAEGAEGEQAAAPPAEGAEGGEHAEHAEGEQGEHGEGHEGAAAAAPGEQVPLPIKERNSQTAVAIDRDLYILCGDNNGDMLREFAMCDTTDTACANWMEPIVTAEDGIIPAPRRAAAAAACAPALIFMFGGVQSDPQGQNVTTDELVRFEVTGPNSLHVTVNPPVTGPKPPARSFATMQEYSNGKLFLYGGLNADGKALNDAWLLDVPSMTWECVFNGHTDLVLPTGGCGCRPRRQGDRGVLGLREFCKSRPPVRTDATQSYLFAT